MPAQRALQLTDLTEEGLTRPSISQWHILTAALLSLDASALAAAFALAYLIRFKTGVPLLETPPHSLAFYSSLAYWAVPG